MVKDGPVKSYLANFCCIQDLKNVLYLISIRSMHIITSVIGTTSYVLKTVFLSREEAHN